MNILLINHYVGSDKMGMEFRPYYLSKEWVESGHSVNIVGATFSHLRKVQPASSGIERIDGINYHWLWTNSYSGNGITRFINMLLFVVQLMLRAVIFAFRDKPDVVIASSTYTIDIFPAWLIAKLSGAKLIFEIHDLWPMSPIELGGMPKWHPFVVIMRFGEWFSYKFSDHIISILPAVYGHLKKDGVPRNKITYIPNGVLLNDKKGIKASLPSSLQSIIRNNKKKFAIGYAGSIGPANPLHNMFKALEGMDDVAFIVIGGGPSKDEMMEKSKHLKNVFFHDRIAKEQVQPFLQQLNACYIEWSNTKLYKYGVGANKIFDYMLSGKPVLQMINTDYDLIEDAECGITVGTDDYKALKEAISTLRKLPAKKLTTMGQNGKKYVLERHNYEQLANDFLAAVCQTKK